MCQMDCFESMHVDKDNNEDEVCEDNVTDTLCIGSIRGWRYNIIYSISGKDDQLNGHLDKTIELMEGKRFTGLNLEPDDLSDIDEGLYEIGIDEAFRSRRDPSCKVILQSRAIHMKQGPKNRAAADHFMREDINIVKGLTELLNESLCATMQIQEWHDCIVAAPIHETNEHGEPVSLDYYLFDPDVIYVMENSECDLGPNFAHTQEAAMFFSPGRKTYPEEVRKYGFVDSE